MKANERRLFWRAAMLMICALPGIANASWWNGDWQFRKRLTLDAAVIAAGAGSGVADISLPVRLHAGNFGYFNDMQASGADLRFIAADDKTPLDYRLERIDAAAGVAVAWVKVPVAALSGDRSYIWMYYGSPGGKAASSNQVDDATVVASFDFAEANGPPRDGTAYASNPRPRAPIPPRPVLPTARSDSIRSRR